MTRGVITLLYKGKGSRAVLDSYRPITLLNSDYKLLAKALASTFGPALQHIIDEQTLPQVSQSRGRRRSDRRFFEALETCVGNPKLAPRPRYYYFSDAPTAVGSVPKAKTGLKAGFSN